MIIKSIFLKKLCFLFLILSIFLFSKSQSFTYGMTTSPVPPTLPCFLSLNAQNNELRMNDSLALVALFEATNGSEWTNSWNLNEPIDTWYGVTLNGDRDRVSRLNLSGSAFNQGNNLNGILPEALGELTALNLLAITNNNSLRGNIPRNLNRLTRILQIFLDNNNLTGDIPIQLYELTTLQLLYLNNNELSGNLHPNIGNLSDMRDLRLHSNSFEGSIPSSIGLLEPLRVLFIDNNNLTGNIPAEIGNLENLEELQLNNNMIAGNIPTELGQLNLYTLNLSFNRLTGSIPSSLSSMNRLNTLFLRNNQLSGCIPIEFSDFCNNGTNVNLSNNCQLPWAGEFRNFCSEETQDGAPCHICVDTDEGATCEDCMEAVFNLINCSCGEIECVEPIAEIGSSTILNCIDTIALLDASSSSIGNNFNYRWTTEDGNIISSDTLFEISVNQPGTYTLTVTNLEGRCSTQNEVIVLEDRLPPTANAGDMQSLSCQENMLQLDGSNSIAAQTFEWYTETGNIISDNQQAIIEVNQAGTYFLMVQAANGCMDLDSTVVLPIEMLDTAAITKIAPSCDGQENGQISIDIIGGTPPYNYIFNGEAFTNNSFNNLPEGIYEVTIIDAADCRLDLSPIELIAASSIPINIDKTVLASTCERESIILNACVTSTELTYDFEWFGENIIAQNDNFNCSELTIIPVESSFYELIIRDENGCEFNDSLFVPVVGFEERDFVITPNGDGIDDVLAFPCTNQTGELTIKDRRGSQLFHEMPYNNDWGGNRNGQLLPYGTYYYVFRFDTVEGKTLYGSLLLLP